MLRVLLMLLLRPAKRHRKMANPEFVAHELRSRLNDQQNL